MKKIILGLMVLSVMIGGGVVYAIGPEADGGVSGRTPPDGGISGKPDPAVKSSPAQTLKNPLNATSVKDVIYIGVAFAILAIIFVGFKFVLAQGKPEAIKEAQMWFFYIIIGLAILISSKV